MRLTRDVVKQFISRAGLDAVDVTVRLDDGTEAAGDLEAWQQDDDDSWRGYVRYSVGGERYLGWFAADRITQTAPGDDDPAAT